MMYKIKWFFQRLFRGYSDCDLWNLDYHLAKIILKRLKAFKKMERKGIPSTLNSFDEWNKILDKMIFSFEFIRSDYGWDENFIWHDEIWEKLEKKEKIMNINIGDKDFYSDIKFNAEKHDEYYQKYEEGMELFSKYFGSLWD